MNSINDIEFRVSKVLSQIIKSNAEPSKISVSNSENWDSLNNLNLVIALEEEFNIIIEPEDFPLLHTDYEKIFIFILEKIKDVK